MRLRRMMLVYALIAVFATASLASARTMTLDECIEHALKTRESIIRARSAESLAGANRLAALGAFLPTIDASYVWSKGEEWDIAPPNVIRDDTGAVIATSDEQTIGPNKTLGVDASMWFFNLTTWFNYFGARADKEAASLNVLDSEDDLIFAVKTAYYAYLASAEAVDVQQQAVERAQEQLKLIQSRFDLGSANRSEVLRQKVQVGNDQLALLQAENSVVTTRANLAYTIGVDPNGNVEFATDAEERAYDGTLDEALGYGLNNEPGLQAVQKDVSASKHAVRSRWSEYLPRLAGFATFDEFNGTQAFPVVFERESKTARWGFQVTWNIFDGFNRERNVTSAKVSLNNARAAEADTRNFLVSEIKSAYFEIQQQMKAKELAGQNVEASTEDMKITQEKYNLGAATILDLLTAQVTLQEAQLSLVQAIFDLNLAVSRLEQAIGKR